MTELEEVRDILQSRNCTCVIMKDDQVQVSWERGIRTILEWLEADPKALQDAVVCDKVVGKAAALLFAYGGIRKIHAIVISNPALAVLEEHGILCSFDGLASRIQNRDHSGLCPMETKALDIQEPEEAYAVFRKLVLEK